MPKRWLPDHVYEKTDRHGRKRYRYQRRGHPSCYFSAAPGTPEFMAEWKAIADRAEARAAASAAGIGAGRAKPGSIDDLATRFYASPAWAKQAPATQATYRGIIDRFRERRKKNGARYGDLPVAQLTTAALDRILGGMAETPAAANNLRKVLKRMLRYAVKIGMRADNPADLTEGYRAGAGFHTWTEEEIARYRATHPNGTKARLALELALNTAARRCNIAALTRPDIRDGRIRVQHAKRGDPTSVPIFPETRAALDALGVTGIGHLIVTEFGKPFTTEGFGNKFRDWCDQAGLPHCSIHGLRKAMSRRLAEAGATDAQGRAFTGQTKNETFAYYAAKANRERLADAAVANLSNAKVANPEQPIE